MEANEAAKSELEVTDMLARMVEKKASDLFITAGVAPCIKVHGKLHPVDDVPLTPERARELVLSIMNENQRKEFVRSHECNFAISSRGVGRFRVSAFYQRNLVGMVLRRIESKIPTVDELQLPAIINELAMTKRGLIIFVGATGTGKSTSLAAMVGYRNRNSSGHIITIEDPIEFVHHPKQCIVNHREVESHTQSFAKALRAALREDPDIILVGEMRDLETTMLAIEAANTGHLVLSTMHTMGATRTIDRIVDMFPADQQSQIRTSLSESLKGVMSQALFKRADKPGRIAALEILLVTPAAANLIREQKTYQLMTVIQTGRRLGMISLDDAVADLLQRRLISPEEAFEKAVEKDRFAKLLKAPPPDF